MVFILFIPNSQSCLDSFHYVKLLLLNRDARMHFLTPVPQVQMSTTELSSSCQTQQGFSDQRQTGIITQTALAIPDRCHCEGESSLAYWAVHCIAHSHNVSDEFSPHTHYMCHPPKSPNRVESCIQKMIHTHSSTLTDSEQCLKPVPNLG